MLQTASIGKAMKTSGFVIGIFLSLATGVSATVRYVDVNSTNATPPYTNWATAAITIQDAVDAANPGDDVLVTNGVYATGFRRSSDLDYNRVVVGKALQLRSVNGPASTLIDGGQMYRCVYLTNDALLSGFTLTNGGSKHGGGAIRCASTNSLITECVITGNGSEGGGGGAYSGTLSNCSIVRNLSSGGLAAGAGEGGGVYRSSLFHCTVMRNFADAVGGGAADSTLNNCLVVSNRAQLYGGASYLGFMKNCLLSGNSVGSAGILCKGGGAFDAALENCTVANNTADLGGGLAVSSGSVRATNSIIYFNSATNSPDYIGGAQMLDHCCTPTVTGGNGCISNEPAFVNRVIGDFRLDGISPCINSGRTLSGSVADLDDNPRISGGTVDIGAYEFQSPASQISYVWLQQYGLTNDGSTDFADTDGDSHNNWQEWRAGTIPTNSASVLRLQNPTNDASGVDLNWQSVAGKTYFLERATDLSASPLLPVASNILGQAGTTSYLGKR